MQKWIKSKPKHPFLFASEVTFPGIKLIFALCVTCDTNLHLT